MSHKEESFNDRFFNGRGKVKSAQYAARLSGRCAKCDKAALRRVGTKGYCKQHFAAAVSHQRKVQHTGDFSARVTGVDFASETGER
jgi:hypothetical protein